ncbi:hypothetical protein ACRALDRAFT_1070370 [Sodiomyces alcalophilus JCM 7366]|uniref:uncharacterized protein n=1 Tax=Sodiomyces alcalophilus JCM 7366 TaxID=591952 RepID=UPI0039B3EC6C
MTLEGLRPRGPTACTTCARAKSKCIPGPPDSGKCERCHRLEKSCVSQVPARPRAKKEPRPTKVAELEKRLAELASQLHVAQAQASASASASGLDHAATPMAPLPVTRPTNRWFNHIFPEVTERDLADEDGGGSSTSEDAGEPPPGNFMSGSRDDGSGGRKRPRHPVRPDDVLWPTGCEAEQLLQTFREVMVPLYPFVVPPPDLTACQLAARHPFLFKGVVVVAYHLDAFRQLVLGDRLLGEISQAAITKPRNSLDVLQGLQLITNLLFLARSMCIGLGCREGSATQCSRMPGVTLDHMRAFTGCYYLNSLMSNTDKTPNPWIITPYLENCCGMIEERAEYPTDQLLVRLFRIQQVAQSISLSLGQQGGISTTLQSMQLPVTTVVQSFQQQIDMFKTSLPDGLKTNPVAEVVLFEIGIPESQNPDSVLQHPDRLGLLWRCLGAARRFLDVRFGGPVYVQPRFTWLGASDWLYVILVCLKLLALQVPGWDLSAVSRQIPLDEMADREVDEVNRYAERRRQGRGEDELVASPASKVPGYFDPLDRFTQIISHLKVIVARELDAQNASFSCEGQHQQQPQDPQWQQQQQLTTLGLTVDDGSHVSASEVNALAVAPGMRTFSDPFWEDAFNDPSGASFMDDMNAMTDFVWNY